MNRIRAAGVPTWVTVFAILIAVVLQARAAYIAALVGAAFVFPGLVALGDIARRGGAAAIDVEKA